jgi:hypothetical protein
VSPELLRRYAVAAVQRDDAPELISFVLALLLIAIVLAVYLL